MVIVRVPLVESLHQTAMGQILALECVPLDAHGLLRPHPIFSGNKCYRFLSHWHWWTLSSSGSPLVGRLDAQACPGLGREVERVERQ
jgi:hypothetical protein